MTWIAPARPQLLMSHASARMPVVGSTNAGVLLALDPLHHRQSADNASNAG